jgi:hypothetical protein
MSKAINLSGKKPSIVELNSKKLSTEELTKLQEAVGAVNNIQMQIGGVEAQKHELLHQIATASKELTDVQKGLEEKYGSVSVDINTGEIKDEEPNTED